LTTPNRSPAGLIYGLAAYGLWGVMPLYFRVVKKVDPLELLTHRVVWSVLLLAGLMTALRRWPEVRVVLRNPITCGLLAASTVFIAVNWYVFIVGVSTGRVVQNSLGYFINPLFSILLGVVVFRERLRVAQWGALALASAGLVYLVVAVGEVPWIALALATSFSLYGLVRKVAPVESLVGLTVETMFLAPFAVAALGFWASRGTLMLGTMGGPTDAAVVASGVVTAVPLLCFGAAARRLPLSTMGFLQYLAPTLQFLFALYVFGERFGEEQRVGFSLIWSALVIVTADAILARRSGARGGPSPVAEVT
jgi:chloramphenicol-sensitive protein RarD